MSLLRFLMTLMRFETDSWFNDSAMCLLPVFVVPAGRVEHCRKELKLLVINLFLSDPWTSQTGARMSAWQKTKWVKQRRLWRLLWEVDDRTVNMAHWHIVMAIKTVRVHVCTYICTYIYILTSPLSSYRAPHWLTHVDLCRGWGCCAVCLNDHHYHRPHLPPQTQETEAERGADEKNVWENIL